MTDTSLRPACARVAAILLLGLGCAPGEDPSQASSQLTHVSIAPTLAGLVAYYALDDHADDTGPLAWHGDRGETLSAPDRFDIAGGALRFDGEDDFIGLPGPLLGGRLENFTVSLWFRLGDGDRAVLLSEGRDNEPGLLIRVAAQNGRIICKSKDYFDLKVDQATDDGLYHHLVLTASGGQHIALWFDGLPIGELSLEAPYVQTEVTESATVLGRKGPIGADDPKDHLGGDLDDVAVYERPLTDDEIAALHREGPPRPPVADAGPGISRFGTQVEVDGGRSTDPDGEIVSWRWDFGDGSPAREGERLSHTFPAFGVYTVTLTVTDDDGSQDTDTVEVSVRDPECVTLDCDQVDTWPEPWSELEVAMLDEVNRYRSIGATCGDVVYAPTHPLEMNEVVRVAARLHSLDMAERDFFDHTNPDGLSPFDRMEDVGYEGPDPWGENIQAGSSEAEDAMLSLINSPGHCANIMDPDYRVMGIGYVQESESSMVHYWTQNFGGGH